MYDYSLEEFGVWRIFPISSTKQTNQNQESMGDRSGLFAGHSLSVKQLTTFSPDFDVSHSLALTVI